MERVASSRKKERKWKLGKVEVKTCLCVLIKARRGGQQEFTTSFSAIRSSLATKDNDVSAWKRQASSFNTWVISNLLFPNYY